MSSEIASLSTSKTTESKCASGLVMPDSRPGLGWSAELRGGPNYGPPRVGV